MLKPLLSLLLSSSLLFLWNVDAYHPVQQHTRLFGSSSSSSVDDDKKFRCRCRVAYDGTKFRGFQVQDRKKDTNRRHRSVQGEIEAVLEQRFQRLIRVVGAGRTDTGVHARGQAVHFDLMGKELLEDMEMLEYSLNRMLPSDICVWNVQRAPEPQIYNGIIHPWNAMFRTTGKLYSYRFSTSLALHPSLRLNRWQIDSGWFEGKRIRDVDEYGCTVFRSPLSAPEELERLQRILNHYQGTKQFVCFVNALEKSYKRLGHPSATVRTVYNVTLVDEGDENYRIDFHLKGALYKMIRNLVGTAIDVWCGRLSEEEFKALLPEVGSDISGLSRKTNLCMPAPPQGLTMERVFYEGDDF